MALLLKTNGTTQPLDLPVNPEDRAAFLRQLVGGCVTVIYRQNNKMYLGCEQDPARLSPINPFLPFRFYGDLVCVQTPEEVCEAAYSSLSWLMT